MTTTFTNYDSGKSVIVKDPDARKLYGINLTDVCAEASTGISSVTISEAVGVEVVTSTGNPGDAFILNTYYCAAWVAGGDSSLAENYITFRYTLTNGHLDEKTLYFKIKDNLSWR